MEILRRRPAGLPQDDKNRRDDKKAGKEEVIRYQDTGAKNRSCHLYPIFQNKKSRLVAGFFYSQKLDLEVIDVGSVDIAHIGHISHAISHGLFFAQAARAGRTFWFVDLKVNPSVILSADNL